MKDLTNVFFFLIVHSLLQPDNNVILRMVHLNAGMGEAAKHFRVVVLLVNRGVLTTNIVHEVVTGRGHNERRSIEGKFHH